MTFIITNIKQGLELESPKKAIGVAMQTGWVKPAVEVPLFGMGLKPFF